MSRPSLECAKCGAKFRGDWTLCASCVDDMAKCLVALFRRTPDHRGRPMHNMFDELLITATRQARLTDSLGGRAGAETPLVFHAPAADKLRALSAFLRISYEHYWRALRATNIAWDTPLSHAAWLHAHASEIARFEDAGEFAETLERLASEAAAVIDRPADMWFAGPCPQCGADLYATEGAGQVKCRECGEAYDVATQRDRLLAAVDDVLATAAEISRAVHLTGVTVTPSKITNLYHRGKLSRHGRSRTGDHLYRMGDVLAVIGTDRR